MENEDNKFIGLIELASSCLGKSLDDIKHHYKDYPLCLMEHVNNDMHDMILQISLEDKTVALFSSISSDNICCSSYLLFDSRKDEESFIDYLVENTEFHFRKTCWMLDNCFLRVRETEEHAIFCFFDDL